MNFGAFRDLRNVLRLLLTKPTIKFRLWQKFHLFSRRGLIHCQLFFFFGVQLRREKHEQQQTGNRGGDNARISPVKAFGGQMLGQYAKIRPNQHQPIGDIFVFAQAQNSDHRPHNKNDARPNIIGNAKSVPAHTHQKHRDIGNRRHRDPAKIHAKRSQNKKLFARRQPLRSKNIGDFDEKREQRRHDEYRQTDEIVMPGKNPRNIGNRSGDKKQIDFFQQRFILSAFGKLINHITGKQKIDHPPNGKRDPRGSKKIGIGIRYLAGAPIVDRQGIGQKIHRHHGNIGPRRKNFNKRVFHI